MGRRTVAALQVGRLPAKQRSLRGALAHFGFGKTAFFGSLPLIIAQDSPEHADLENNLAACDAFLDFAASIPSTLSARQSDGVLPSFPALESAAVGALISSTYKASRPKPTATAPATPKKKAKARASRLPASLKDVAPEDRPPVDPERWLPKRERASYKDELAAKQRQKEAKERQREKLTVQGSAAPAAAPVAKAAATGGAAKKKGAKKGKK
jgi:signal recognition particle subunit SRP72